MDDGSETTVIRLPVGDVLVAQQSEFRLRWFFTKVHLFFVVLPVTEATPELLHALTEAAVRFASDRSGDRKGLLVGTNIAVIPVLVAESVSVEAKEAVCLRPTKGWSAFLLPAIKDLSTGMTHSYEGRVVWGGIYSSWIRDRLNCALPPSDP